MELREGALSMCDEKPFLLLLLREVFPWSIRWLNIKLRDINKIKSGIAPSPPKLILDRSCWNYIYYYFLRICVTHTHTFCPRQIETKRCRGFIPMKLPLIKARFNFWHLPPSGCCLDATGYCDLTGPIELLSPGQIVLLEDDELIRVDGRGWWRKERFLWRQS